MNFAMLLFALALLSVVVTANSDLLSECASNHDGHTFDYTFSDHNFRFECYREGDIYGYRPIACISTDGSVQAPGDEYIDGQYFKYACVKDNPDDTEIETKVIACMTPLGIEMTIDGENVVETQNGTEYSYSCYWADDGSVKMARNRSVEPAEDTSTHAPIDVSAWVNKGRKCTMRNAYLMLQRFQHEFYKVPGCNFVTTSDDDDDGKITFRATCLCGLALDACGKNCSRQLSCDTVTTSSGRELDNIVRVNRYFEFIEDAANCCASCGCCD